MKIKICVMATVLVLTAAGLRAQGDRGIITGTVKDCERGRPARRAGDGDSPRYEHQLQNHHDCLGRLHRAGAAGGQLPGASRKHTGSRRTLPTTLWWQPERPCGWTWRWKLGTTQQTVEVQANAQMLQTDTARVSTEVSNKLVDDLPLVVNGAVRSPFDLAATTAEARAAGTPTSGSAEAGLAFTA